VKIIMKFTQTFLQQIKENDLDVLNLHLYDVYDDNIEKIIEALMINTTITTIYINCRQLTALGVILLFTAIRETNQVKTIHLSNCHIGITQVQALNILLTDHLSLIDLSLYSSQIDVATLSQALYVNQTLKILDLSWNRMGSHQVIFIKEMLQHNRGLKELNLSGNNLEDTGVQYLFEGLLLNQTLTILHLRSNAITMRNVGVLGKALQYSQTLINLDLSHNRIDDLGLDLLSHGLVDNRSLCVLNLAKNTITGHGCKALSDTLKINRSLLKLDLSENNIGFFGAEVLSAAMQEDGNQTLTALNLNSNEIGDQGVIALTQMLQKNKIVSELLLYNNNISDRGAYALGLFLQTQSSLIELDLGGNYISHSGIQVLMKALQNNLRLTGFNYSTRSYTNKLSVCLLAPSVNLLLQSNGILVRFGLEDNRFDHITSSAIKKNQQNARMLLEAICTKNTKKAIKLLDQGINPFVAAWQCDFEPCSHNMALHWIALSGNVRLMCEMVARYKYFLHYRNQFNQSVLDIITIEQKKTTQKCEYVWLNMQKLCILNRERIYKILALTRVLYQSSLVSSQFNLFTKLPFELQSKVLSYLVGGEESMDIFANITYYARERQTLWNESSQFLRFCLWGGMARWYQDSEWSLSFCQRYEFLERLFIMASNPLKKSTVLQLSAFLNTCQSVTTLNLSKHALIHYQMRDVSLITPRCSHRQVVNVMLRLLKTNRTLKKVHFGSILMTMPLIEKLVEVLNANTTLTKILINGFDYIPICQRLNWQTCNLSQQDIGGEQGKVIGLLLSTKQHIKHLNLSANPLSHESIKMILWALKDHHNLQSLDLRFSWIDEECAMVLWHLLQENRYIKQVRIDFDWVNKNIRQCLIKELAVRQSTSYIDNEEQPLSKVAFKSKSKFFSLPPITKKDIDTRERSKVNTYR
jgi:Ran GTPase-activating protein (RanGAP) involved in mRNA processing and transport